MSSLQCRTETQRDRIATTGRHNMHSPAPQLYHCHLFHHSNQATSLLHPISNRHPTRFFRGGVHASEIRRKFRDSSFSSINVSKFQACATEDFHLHKVTYPAGC
eukprot:GHVT01069071.1.p1 GENE.GHVT01069071.1~~GHVT01069071.1.p1  ORF type:complete len:104 (+),score=0.56 GHVT01069071.1:136-447(+)